MRHGKCETCDLPLVEVDAFGEHLRGCVGCNNWRSVNSGEWRQLADEDIAALRGLKSGWRWPVLNDLRLIESAKLPVAPD
jgi:hypothetical protein